MPSPDRREKRFLICRAERSRGATNRKTFGIEREVASNKK